MKLMNKNDFQEIFKDDNIKDKIKDITLIISTQLAEDVYDIPWKIKPSFSKKIFVKIFLNRQR